MKIINHSIISSNIYQFIVKCDKCNYQYIISGPLKHIKNVLTSSNHGCPICGKTNGMSLEKFLYKLNKNNLYDRFEYPNLKDKYIDGNTEITIICKIHGEFKCSPYKHLKTINGGCPKCTKNIFKTKDEWLKHVNQLYNFKYSYPNLDNEYKNFNSIITIICPIHGKFKQNAGLHYRGCQCKRCAGRGILFDKKDKLNILTEYDLLSMDWAVILDLIGEDKLPNEFKCLCKFGENTPERKKMIDDLKETYNIETTDEEEISEVENNIDDSIETEVNDINSEENIYNETDEDIELDPLKEIKDIGSLLNKDNEDIFSTGDKFVHIIHKQMNRIWNLVLRDNENHSTKNIEIIKSKLNDNITKFERYIYEEFLKEYDEVINLEIH